MRKTTKNVFLFFFNSSLYIHAGPRLSFVGLPDMPELGHYLLLCLVWNIKTLKNI